MPRGCLLPGAVFVEASSIKPGNTPHIKDRAPRNFPSEAIHLKSILGALSLLTVNESTQLVRFWVRLREQRLGQDTE
jgi:hypothetical protein